MPIFKRLPQYFQDMLFEFRQFIKKKNTVMGQTDLSGPRNVTAADQPRV